MLVIILCYVYVYNYNVLLMSTHLILVVLLDMEMNFVSHITYVCVCAEYDKTVLHKLHIIPSLQLESC